MREPFDFKIATGECAQMRFKYTQLPNPFFVAGDVTGMEFVDQDKIVFGTSGGELALLKVANEAEVSDVSVPDVSMCAKILSSCFVWTRGAGTNVEGCGRLIVGGKLLDSLAASDFKI